MTIQNMQFQQETRASIQSLTNQMGQMATQLNQAQPQNFDKLPSQTIAITLRYDKQFEVPLPVAAPAPEPVKLHSTPEKEDEIVAQKRKLPNKNFHAGGPSSKSECTNHVPGSTYTSDLLYEVQAEEPSSNLRWTSPPQQQQPVPPFQNVAGPSKPYQQQQQRQQATEAPPQPSLEELVRQMTIQNMQFQQETRASIQSLTNQMGQMATQLNQAQPQNFDKLPSQTIAITLRYDKQFEVPLPVAAPAPEPVKLHSTPEKEDEIVAQKRKLPNKNFHAGGPSSKSECTNHVPGSTYTSDLLYEVQAEEPSSNLRWTSPPQQQQPVPPFQNVAGPSKPYQQQQQRQQATEAPPQPSLEELVRQMTIQNMQFQQETRASIQSLTNQMGQMATQLNQAQPQNFDKLPSQTIAITLRYDKQFEVPLPVAAPAPEPVKLHSTPEKEDEIVAQKRKLPNKNFHAGGPSSKSECTNHVPGSTYTSDLLYEVQAEEPSSNLRWTSPPQQQQPVPPFQNVAGPSKPYQQQQQRQQATEAPPQPSLEELVRQMTIQNMQFQQETRASIQSLTNQMGQMATQLNQAQPQNFDKLPSQTIAITLRYDKQFEVPLPVAAPAPEPVKLHSTPEKEDEIVAQKRKLPNKNFHAGGPSSKSECTNHVPGSTYTSDLLYEVQAEEPSSNLRWTSPPQQQQPVPPFQNVAGPSKPYQQQQQRQQATEAPPQPSLEELVRQMTIQNMQFQQETRASIQSLTNQMGQMATQLNQAQPKNFDKLPSQTIAITLRYDKQFEVPLPVAAPAPEPVKLHSTPEKEDEIVAQKRKLPNKNFHAGGPSSKSECTNHVPGSTYTSDLLYEVQAEEPSSNLRWTSPPQQQQPVPPFQNVAGPSKPYQQQQQRQQATEAPPQPSLEELVRQMTIQNMQFQQETRASIQSLTNQMGQMATQLNQAQPQNFDKLPSQTIAITLRCDKQFEVPLPVAAPAPEPVKLHSTPEKEDEIVAQKRKLPNKNFHAGGPSSKSECTNHVPGSTYTSDLLYEVQAEEPSSNLRWTSPPQQQQPVPPFQNVAGPSKPYQQQQQRQQATEAPPQPSLEELVRQMTIQNMQFQQETRASIQSLTNQMGQMATQLNQAQPQNFDKLPSQTIAITLRCDKQFEVPLPVAAPAPEPVKLHSTPEKEDEIVAQKRKLPNKNFHAGGPSSKSECTNHVPGSTYTSDLLYEQQQQQRQQATEAPPQPSLEELVRQMTIQNMQFQQETRASIQSLTNQMGQMATQLNQAQPQNFDKLPSQTIAITLRYDKQFEVPLPVAAPAPEPVKLHSTPEKEDEIVAQKRKLPNKNFHAGGPSSKSECTNHVPGSTYTSDLLYEQQQQQRQQATEAPPQPSLEELVRQMTIQNMQFQQETRASIQSLTNQMGQMATQLNQAQPKNFDKLPSQTIAITLRYDKQFEVPLPVAAPAPEPVKLHSTPEKEDEIVAQKRKLPNKNFHAGGPSSKSECTNHVPGSTYTSDLLYEVQAEEPSSSSPIVVPPTV
ncbi:hypothetical protein HKD37_20G055499 [Glycine soja]